MLHGRGVHAANGEVQVDAAEYFNPRHFLAHDVRQRTGRIVVVLQHNRAHSAQPRQLGDINRIDRARTIVRIAVHVDIDGPGKYAGRIIRCAALSHFCVSNSSP